VDENDEFTKTSIDLGEDLLQKFRESEPPPTAPTAEETQTNLYREDVLRNAWILEQEGFVEKAKKLLLDWYVQHPEDDRSYQQLKALQSRELDLLIRAEFTRRQQDSERFTPAEEIIGKLETQFRFQLSPDSGLEDAKVYSEFCESLWEKARTCSTCEKLILAESIYQMDLLELVQDLVNDVLKDRENLKPIWEASALALKGQCLLRLGKPNETVDCLEPWLLRRDLPDHIRMEFSYWIGRAKEAMRNDTEGLSWYLAVSSIEPEYRDLQDRITRLRKRLDT
jgi:hypothetical protein